MRSVVGSYAVARSATAAHSSPMRTILQELRRSLLMRHCIDGLTVRSGRRPPPAVEPGILARRHDVTECQDASTDYNFNSFPCLSTALAQIIIHHASLPGLFLVPLASTSAVGGRNRK